MKMVIGGLCVLLSALTMNGEALKSTSSCESQSSLALPDTSITLAQVVPARAFTLPGTAPASSQLSQLPTFCRVEATLTPSLDSDIKNEVWLPVADWNGEFQAVDNSGRWR
jgi:feruloyl esterase